MKINMGGTDRMVRLFAAILVGILYFMEIISGTVAIILGIIAAIFILTSLVGFCPLYAPFRLNTKKKTT